MPIVVRKPRFLNPVHLALSIMPPTVVLDFHDVVLVSRPGEYVVGGPGKKLLFEFPESVFVRRSGIKFEESCPIFAVFAVLSVPTVLE